MNPIYKNLFQFSSYIPPIDFTIHHYLLAADPAILFASGTMQQAQESLPQIQQILKGRPLGYLFVSHMESDECGGLSVFHDAYPEMKTICSELGSRELPGFGYSGKLMPVSGTSTLQDGELNLRFFDYPSEVHLQNGILAYESNSGIFYSADLMLRYGNGEEKVIHDTWKAEVDAIDEKRVPSAVGLEKLKEDLLTIHPKFVAVGHGFCVECE